MSNEKGMAKLEYRMEKANTLLCVGLDSDVDKIPERFRVGKTPQFEFNKWIIKQTHKMVCAYKLNSAFYEANGPKGLEELKLTVDYLREKHPDIFVICDAKRADIGSTNEGYVKEIFDWLGADAVTLNPYLGQEALAPFLGREDKVCIILCRTSNPGAGEFQDLKTEGMPLWQVVAQKVNTEWNKKGNCMLVVGATYPEELKKIRELIPEMTFLVPGIGAQGGEIEKVMKAGMNSLNRGVVINNSRAIIFANDPMKAAEEYCRKINACRQ